MYINAIKAGMDELKSYYDSEKKICTLEEDKDHYFLATEDFFLKFKFDDGKILLFCKVDLPPNKVANIMILLNEYIPIETIKVCGEYFINTETEVVHYGDDAVLEYAKDLHRKRGLVECFCCGKFFMPSDIINGFCGVCKDTVKFM